MEMQKNNKIVFGATLSDVKMNLTIYAAIVYRFKEDGTKNTSFANGGEYRYDFSYQFFSRYLRLLNGDPANLS